MTVTTDLYVRGAATLLASWEEYARGSAGATLRRLDGVAAAVFPNGPERAVYNNALLDRDLGPAERAAAVGAMEAAYTSASSSRRRTGPSTCGSSGCPPASSAAPTQARSTS